MKLGAGLLWATIFFLSLDAVCLILLLIVGAGSVDFVLQGDDSIPVVPDQLINAGYVFFVLTFISSLAGLVAVQNRFRKLFIAHLVFSFLICLFVFCFGIFAALSFKQSIDDSRLNIWKDAYNEFFVKQSISSNAGWTDLQNKLDCCGTNIEAIGEPEKFGVSDVQKFVFDLLSGDACNDLDKDVIADFVVDFENASGFEAAFIDQFGDDLQGVEFCEEKLDQMFDNAAPYVIAFAALSLAFSLIYTALGVSLIGDDYFEEDPRNMLTGTNPVIGKTIGRTITQSTSQRSKQKGGQPLKKIASLAPGLQGFEPEQRQIEVAERRRKDTIREHFEAQEKEAARKSLKQVQEEAERNKPKKMKLMRPRVQASQSFDDVEYSEKTNPRKKQHKPKGKMEEQLRNADSSSKVSKGSKATEKVVLPRSSKNTDAETALTGLLEEDEKPEPPPRPASKKNVNSRPASKESGFNLFRSMKDIIDETLPRTRVKRGKKEQKKEDTSADIF